MVVALDYVDVDARAVLFLIFLVVAIVATCLIPRRIEERPSWLIGLALVGTLAVLTWDAVAAAGW